ncbi:MAG: hypothetical protein HY810_06045 [Candidatus Omnitrophica bacterium]|nr:hypothetical protein [Candidatus Omnitrophota bacterium]
MSSLKKEASQFLLIRESWSQLVGIIINQPKIMLPFAIMSTIEVSGIVLIFMLLQDPWVNFIRPVIKWYWQEQFLHYPLNLVLLAQLFYYFQVIITLIIGTLITGMTINAINQYKLKGDFSFKKAFWETLPKYVHLLIISVILLVAITFAFNLQKILIMKLIAKNLDIFTSLKANMVNISIFTGTLINGLLQSFFIFACPAIMINNKNCLAALFSSVWCAFSKMFAVLMIVLVPLSIYIPIAMLKGKLFYIMDHIVPEITLFILLAGIIVTLLINVVITVSSTQLYMLIKGQDK